MSDRETDADVIPNQQLEPLTDEEMALKLSMLAKAQNYREGQEKAFDDEIDSLLRLHIK